MKEDENEGKHMVMSLQTGAPRQGSPKVTKARGLKVQGVVRVGDRLCDVGERCCQMRPDAERCRERMGDDER